MNRDTKADDKQARSLYILVTCFLKGIADTVGYWNYAEKADEVRFAPHPSIWGILPRDIARLSAYTSEMYS